MLLERAFLTRDELLFKVVRNLSQQADLGTKGGFLPYMDQLADLLQVWDIAGPTNHRSLTTLGISITFNNNNNNNSNHNNNDDNNNENNNNDNNNSNNDNDNNNNNNNNAFQLMMS